MIQPAANAVTIDVRVVARAGRSGLAGVRDNRLLVRLNAAPVDGAANAELIEVIASACDVPRRAVEIVKGERSRQKRVRVAGLDVATAEARLLRHATARPDSI
jgi:uncharacterized protein (TIGR00251 family)